MKWVNSNWSIADRIQAINGTIRIFIEEFRSLAIQREDKISLLLMSALADETKYLCEECGMCEHFSTPDREDMGVYCSKVVGIVSTTFIPCEHFVKRQTEED